MKSESEKEPKAMWIDPIGQQATNLSIRVLKQIIQTIRNEQSFHQRLRELDILSDEDFSLLDTNLEADIKVYQSKINELSTVLNKSDEQWIPHTIS